MSNLSDLFESAYEESLKTELQDHQKRVAEKLKKSGGVLAVHGMGSGKSLMSIGATHGDNPDVVVPASLRTNYQKEIDKHTTGGKAHAANIMSYEKATKEPHATSKTLVMDEPQAIGHADTDRSQAMIKKAAQYDKRLLMTGTPIRNHPHELAPLINIVKGEKALPTDKKEFEQKFIKEIMSKPSMLDRVRGIAPTVIGHDIKNRAELENILKGHVDYHMPDQKDFPSHKEETFRVEMSKEQQNLYDFAVKKLNNPILGYKIRKGLPTTKAEAQQLNAFMSATRQISNTTGAFNKDGTAKVSPKIEKAIEELKKRHDSDPNFRGVVYSNYLDSGVRPYSEELKKHGISHHVFDGSLSDKQREQMVHDYNTGKVKSLLISGAGAQGLDLKGTKLVQILEPHWNSARTEQAKARAIRYKSHDHLPENERHVEVQNFHSTLRPNYYNKLKDAPGKLMDKIKGVKRKPDQSADEYLKDMNEKKDALNQKFIDILKHVGSQRESLEEIFESAYDDKKKAYEEKHKEWEDIHKANQIRNAIGGSTGGAVIGGIYGGIYGSMLGSATKGALAGAAIMAPIMGHGVWKMTDTTHPGPLRNMKALDKDHKIIKKIHADLLIKLHREPTHEEIDHVWNAYEKELMEKALEKQRARQQAKISRRQSNFKADE
jgi:hypothetical protein